MFDTASKLMHGVVIRGHGGLEQLEYRKDLPIPTPEDNEVLIRVGASAVNNTDINTRIGWYSKGVKLDTNEGGVGGFDTANDNDASWSGIPLNFPLIQGADCCGEIVAIGSKVDPARIGERVLVRTMLRTYVGYRPFECWTFGSECNGGFAQYAKAPAAEAYKVESTLSDAELASFPCAYSTAENMIHRAAVKANERVLITGASGGVGSAAVQLAKRRGAIVIAVVSAEKANNVKALGADHIVIRGDDPLTSLGPDNIDVVIDLVAGPQWPKLLNLLARGGRYAVAGAIAGPLVELDVRTLYLKDLTFFGCTFQEDIVFENLIGYIERCEIQPVVSKVYPLHDVVQAQKDFLAKKIHRKARTHTPSDQHKMKIIEIHIYQQGLPCSDAI